MADAPFGPVELVAVMFPEERIPDAVRDSLASLVASDHLRVVDLVVVRRPHAGEVEIIEVDSLGDQLTIAEGELAAAGLAGEEDLEAIAASLPPGASALVFVVEHVWSKGFADTARAAGGVLLLTERIPAEVVTALVELAETYDDIE